MFPPKLINMAHPTQGIPGQYSGQPMGVKKSLGDWQPSTVASAPHQHIRYWPAKAQVGPSQL